jgi:hypothetical protein
MHRHEHDDAVDQAQHPDRRAGTDGTLPYLFRAAAAGRPEVLGPSGVAGLQRAVGNGAVASALTEEAAGEAAGEQRSPVHDVVGSGGGHPLDPDTRADMEGRFGTDFSQVRVHTDGAAHESAKAVGAHAYTVGHNVVFQRDRYDPASPAGRTMLAHELTHVVQQRSGPVDGTEAPGGIRVSDPSDRFEREAAENAERIMGPPSPAAAQAAAPAAAAVQRQEEDEEPADVQGAFVQRAAAGAEEEAGEEEQPA